MNVKSMKKGFTLTELIIVIVIIGILAGVLIPTFINVVNKANRAADISLIRNLNEALTLDKYDNGEHKNMTQALKAADDYGFNVAKISAKVSKNEILWDSKNDVFCYLNNGEIEYYPQSVPQEKEIVISEDVNLDERHLLWIIDDEVNSKFSTYLYGYSGTTSESNPLVASGVGLDTGEYDVAFVKYENTNLNDTKKVVIRTNSAKTTLIINDESKGSVEHYDSVGALKIIKCYTGSYHENGQVAFAEIKTGRIVLENEAEIRHIHLNATGEGTGAHFDNIIVAKAENVEMPDFSRDPVDLSSGSKVVVALQDGTDVEDNKNYVWLTAVGIYEQVTLGTASAAGTDYAATSTTATQEQKTTAQQIANNITFNDGGVDYKVKATPVVGENDEVTGWTYDVVKSNGTLVNENPYTASESGNVISVEKSGSDVPIAPAVENGLDNEEKEEIKTTAIQIAEAEEYADRAILLLGENYSEYMSFAKFRDMANDPANNGLEGFTASLQADVDLKNEEWTPIGTKDNPFRGKFDGGNHVIRNLKINSTTGYAGLFGVVVGEQLNTPKLVSDVWNDSNRSMKEKSYSEDKFTAIIKNVTIDGFSFNSTSNDYHGTVAGFAVDAYFANLTVKNGTISTAGKAGGVIGSTTGSVVFDTLITENSVSVVATGHTAGGIIAGTNRNYVDYSEEVAFTVAEQDGSHVAIIVNCINNATVTGVGYTAGIVGQSANTKGLELVIYNCVNNGNIYQSSTNDNPMGGIAATTNSLSHAVISNCTNNGALAHSTTSTTKVYVAGIDGYGTNTKMYSCINNGNVTGYANKIAGIAAELSSSYTEIDLDTCHNTGVIINTNQSGQTYDVYGGNWAEQNFNASNSIASSVSDIQEKLNSADAVYYNFAGYDSFEGALIINKERSSFAINANSRICSSIVIEGNRSQNITLNIPNLVCTLSGDMSNVNLIIKGENSFITLAEGASLKNVYVSNGASFTNNGTIFKLQLTDIPTATNNGTIGYMSFAVSENVTTNFTNNGTITEQVRSAGQLHLIVSQGKGTVNFLNNGTINYDYENAPYNCASYIFLSRSGDSVTLNIDCTANSVIDGYQDMNWFCMYKSGNTFTVNYLEGAQFTVNGAIPSTNNYSRLAQNFHKVDSLD